MSEFYQPGQHPDADQLNAFAEDALPAHEREQTLAHLAGCSDCRMIVSLALPPMEDVPQMQPVSARKPWFYGWNVAWLAGAGLAALIFLTVHVHNAPNTQRAAAPTTQTAAMRPPSPMEPMPVAPTVMKAAPAPTPQPAPAAAPSVDSLKPPAATPTIDNRQVSNLPLQGRRFIALPPQQQLSPQQAQQQQAVHGSIGGPVSGAAMGGAAGRSNQPLFGRATGSESLDGAVELPPSPPPVAAAPAISLHSVPPPPAASTDTRQIADRASDEVSVNSEAKQMDITNAAVSTTLASLSPIPIHALPSHLAIVSTIARANQMLALDTTGALFVSNDGGHRWKVVAPQWPGRAVRVTLASLPAPPSKAAAMAYAANDANANSTVLRDKDVAPLASVFGLITDSVGATIPGASVIVTDPRTSISHTTRSDRTGHYVVNGLAPGTYRIDVTMPGFETLQTNIALASAQQSVQNLSLTVGAVSESVTVESEGSLQAARKDKRRRNAVTVPPIDQAPPVFEITTDSGELWTSADGKKWQRK